MTPQEEQIFNTRAAQAQSLQQAQLLIEALPWIKEATGKTVVIKYGGAAMTDNKLCADVMSDIVLMKIIGLNPIIVHGGGNEISQLSERLGLPVEFKDGMRVTSPEVMDVVKMVLIGKVNQELVGQMNAHGHLAVGLSGADGHTIKAEPISAELGLTGNITQIDTTLLHDLISSNYVPIIASVAVGADGASYNVNADMAAGKIAAAIGAHKVIFLTDVDGLYADFNDKTSLISRLTLDQAMEMQRSGGLSAGMIPKIQACVTALTAGVSRAHLLNGTIAHALLLEIFTNEGVGTMIMRDDQVLGENGFTNYPLEGLASKLHSRD